VERIGKYQVQKVLGRGGMGTVYEAIDPLINRKVAVKTMIPGLAESGDLRARFLREAQAAGGLQHRNIVTVYDLGEDKGQPYIAMEFIEGTDLEKVVQNREPLTVEWKMDVLRQICEGLGYAHRNGIVHRDIKPANIRVTQGGEVKIMDFGIAHLQSSSLTKSGLVMGTVHYMAPEQIEGHKVDHRADVFSVGAIAYELIAYRKPFDGESLTAVMFRIMNERPDPKPITTPYSPALEAIVMKALERDPLARYQSLDDMQADIEAILRESGTRVPERPAWGRPADERQAKAAKLVEQGQELLAKGEPEAALEKAKEALQVTPADATVRELHRIAEGEVTARRVEKEIQEIRASMERARAEGQLQKALALCRRLMELQPADREIAKAGSEIEIAIHDREVEQLCSLALAYAADGDTELAQKIASKIERLSPRSPRYLKLKAFLDDEQKKGEVEAIVAAAREHLAEGNLVAAHAAAEKVLEMRPDHALAREIRDRTESVLMKAAGPAPEPEPEPASPPAPAPPPPPPPKVAAPPPPPAAPPVAARPAAPPPAPKPAEAKTPAPAKPVAPEPGETVAIPRPQPTPVPTSKPAPPAPPPPAAEKPKTTVLPLVPPPPPGTPIRPAAPLAPAPAPPPPVAAAKAPPAPPPPAPKPAPAPPAPAPGAPKPIAAEKPAAAVVATPASTLTPPPEGRSEAEIRKADVERLTTLALNAFVENNYPKAKKAAEKALGLDPENKKARELMKILGALG
jgi:tetratricopeptide (TPR) repeat protein/predicted Ser/Thr protein kinase